MGGPTLGFISRFTVGGEFCIRVINLSLCQKTRSTRLGPTSSHSPVSLLVDDSYVTGINIPDSYEGIRPIYRGLTVMLMLTRFTVGR